MKNLRVIRNRRSLKMMAVLALSFLFSACADDDGGANPGTSTDQVTAVPFFVQTEGNELPSENDQLLYEVRKNLPVLAPDGHHLTWGEFNKVTGTCQVECTEAGVKTTLELSGLIPDGVYTIWNVVFDSPGMDPAQEMLSIDGVGAAGIGDGSDNSFVASSEGKAEITINSPGGTLSMMGTMGNCPLTDNFEWHVVGSYHMDGKTYGPDLGPDGTVAEQFAFVFLQESL